MAERTGESPRSEGDLLRSVSAIVLTGIALGIAHNVALRIASQPPRGLDWIRQRAELPTLEAQVEPASAPATATSGAAVAAERSGAVSSGYGEMSDPLGMRDVPASGLPEIPDRSHPFQMQLPAVKKFFDAGAAILVDARPREEYETGHIPGALNLPYEEVGFDPERLEAFDPGGKPVIVYCGGGTCELSENLAYALIGVGKRKVLVFLGGWPEWEAAGYPVATGPGEEAGS